MEPTVTISLSEYQNLKEENEKYKKTLKELVDKEVKNIIEASKHELLRADADFKPVNVNDIKYGSMPVVDRRAFRLHNIILSKELYEKFKTHKKQF